MSQPAVKRQRNTEMLRAPSVRDVGMSMLLLLAGRASVLGLFRSEWLFLLLALIKVLRISV